jgi:hypothetical protein
VEKIKVQFIQKVVALSGKTYTVLTPISSQLNLYALEHVQGSYMIFGDQKTLQLLACIVQVSSFQREKMIYIPSRTSVLPADIKAFSAFDKNLGIVLFHHSLQLKLGIWKVLRNRLPKVGGKLVSYKCNPRRFSQLSYDDNKEFTFRENKDHMLIRNHADTLFLIGSEKAFQHTSGVFEPLSRGGASYFLNYGGHAHDHLDLFTTKRQGLCVDFYDEELWKRQRDQNKRSGNKT